MKKQTKQNKLKNYNVYIDIAEISSVRARNDEDAKRKAIRNLEKANVTWTLNDALVSVDEEDE